MQEWRTEMPRIQQLSTSVINKIAAGEVLERPANAVKELLENSVDALASRIEVDILAGGGELIRVVDDGEGIEPADLPLAVSSHATSKIHSADDLFQVHTFGFRGEALASMAEVSRLKIRSRPPTAESGAELEVDLGNVGQVRPCGCPVGTTIEIRDLFANTPVRRKFLKTAATEFGHIAEQFTRVALPQTRLHMVLRHNDKLVYELPATERLLERLQMFYGREVTDKLIWVESEQSGVRMWGYVGHPELHKSTRKLQGLFLNGRWIQDRMLQHALLEAYRGLLMVGRQPVSFLFIETAPDQVDVNVHPTKVEVRFRDGQPLYRQLLAMLRRKFMAMDLQSQLRLPKADFAGTTSVRSTDSVAQRNLQIEFATWATSELDRATSQQRPPRPLPETDWPAEPRHADLSASAAGGLAAVDRLPVATDETATPTAWADVAAAPVPAFPAPSQPAYPLPDWANDNSPAVATPSFATLNGPSADPKTTTIADDGVHEAAADDVATVVAAAMTDDAAARIHRVDPGAPPVRALQVHDCYLVLETAEGITLFDQHALHERILYEQFRDRVLNHAVESQRLLMPQPVELSARETALVLDHRELLAQMGLGVDEFGSQTVLINAYPVMLRRLNLTEFLRDVSVLLDDRGPELSRRDLLEKLLSMMACKAAVKAGQRLTDDEISQLLAQRHLVDDHHHCPHGRPTALKLSREELDRQFGRLG